MVHTLIRIFVPEPATLYLMKSKSMKRHILILCGIAVSLASMAQPRVNLTPRPKSMTTGEGELVLQTGFRVGYGNLPDSLAREAARFVSDINASTPLQAMATNSTHGTIQMEVDGTLSEEGYSLEINSQGATLKARTTAGFFYGFQSLKKILPPNVMARVRDGQTGRYALPALRIEDEPRFGYRGFMLDVSRHFFPLEEIKRMLDVMAAYKLNVFHWHLTDDQGWRAEIKRYPRLTQVGSVARDVRLNPMDRGTYWLGQPYAHYYTQEEMREVVRYAADRHIQVLPEIDMPGHFCAAMASYPEFSCTPEGPHSVQTNQGGVYADVMNVSNPRAVEFAKGILTELMEIFPYPYIHIGGDECPTSAWEKNAECQERYRKLGLTSYRQLQSHFIQEISNHVKAHGRQLIVWNESVTAKGADLDILASTGATVMSWHPCQQGARTAAELGLNTIITEYHTAQGGYYINRKQDPNDKYAAAGAGDDTVEGTYNYVPVPDGVPSELRPRYIGVQGTFWTEWVSDGPYLEYLALPRLIALAEAGWTPQELKDFEDFRQRMALDRKMLDYNHYEYGKHIFR